MTAVRAASTPLLASLAVVLLWGALVALPHLQLAERHRGALQRSAEAPPLAPASEALPAVPTALLPELQRLRRSEELALDQPAAVLRHLQLLATRHALALESARSLPRPTTANPASGFTERSWELGVRGGYRELLEFLAELEHPGAAMMVERLTLRPAAGQRAAPGEAPTLHLSAVWTTLTPTVDREGGPP